MASLAKKLIRLQEQRQSGYWADRIWNEVAYALRLSKVHQGKYDALLDSVLDFLLSAQSEEGAITRSQAESAEERMRELATQAKSFKMICASHAHIDMNWMWSWDETVAVTLDTFRTMLDLMKEYPEFTFSQSQASTYRIVEQYAPEMLDEIRSRVHEGRWEVTASTWVEPDKNMPNGESLARHILYTKRYLAELLNLNAESLNIDFEPDTFGHSLQVPEVLLNGGIKYFYHCRGYDGETMYRWIGPSGASVIAYREPIWYNGEITPDMALYVPEFCTEHQMDTMLKVYGVGDHGGGPTRRDLERMLDMSTWPIFPQIRFGTFHEYFDLMEQRADTLPQVHGELNFVFTGCYTTQSRIKRANRVAEATLQESEMFETVSSLTNGSHYHQEAFRDAWRNVLFNQFHDIIPGSGVIDTREYAMGLFQHTMATANTNRTMAMRRIGFTASNESGIPIEYEADRVEDLTSEGAGVGFGIKDFKVFQSDRGRGKTRVFHVFNAASFARDEAAEIVVWDWPGDVRRLRFQDASGAIVQHQVLEQEKHPYWGHKYLRVLVNARVPACGYSTYVLSEDSELESALPWPRDPRVDRPDSFVLENSLIRVTVSPRTGAIVSVVDKSTSQELIDQSSNGAMFRLIQEDESKGMTAWRVGPYMNVQELTQNVRVSKAEFAGGPIRDAVVVQTEFAHSKLRCVISLNQGSPAIVLDTECDWREVGGRGLGVPQLGYHVPLAYECSRFKYDVPFGVIERPGRDDDVPGNSFVAGMNRSGGSLMLATNSKYGFRGLDNDMGVTLIRSSFDPDPYPEFGSHKFRFALCLIDGTSGKNAPLLQQSIRLNHPLSVISAPERPGFAAPPKGFLSIEEGTVELSAVKLAEDDSGAVIVRIYETEGIETRASLRLWTEVRRVTSVDFNEQPVNPSVAKSSNTVVDGDLISLTVPPYKVVTLRLEF